MSDRPVLKRRPTWMHIPESLYVIRGDDGRIVSVFETPSPSLEEINKKDIDCKWCRVCNYRSEACLCLWEVKQLVVPETKPDEVDDLVFHKNCADGFGAAWSCYKKLGTNGIVFRAMEHSQPVDISSFTGKRVAVFDFTFPKETTEKIKNVCKSFVCWDHHDTAYNALYGKCPGCYFDLEKSGCRLAWEYFFGVHSDVPLLLLYAEDRDLWKWELRESRAVSAYMFYACSLDFDKWDEATATPIDIIIEQGKVLKSAQDERLKQLVEDKNIQMSKGGAVTKKIANYSVMIINAKLNISEIGDELLNRYSNIDFVIIWTYDHWKNQYKIHLRGRQRLNNDKAVHVGEIAEVFGGGGHPDSASFSMASEKSIDGVLAYMDTELQDVFTKDDKMDSDDNKQKKRELSDQEEERHSKAQKK
jgi:hypothetical protein